MKYAIIGSGNVGKALATMFARKGVEATIASRKPVSEITPIATAIGPTIIPKSLKEAVEADFLLLAIPFGTQKEIAKTATTWQGKIVIDVTNAYGVSPDELGGLPSSAVVAQSFPGAALVKAFNHLPAEILMQDPNVKDGKRVIFLASDDERAADKVANLIEQLGFAPVKLGKLNEGGLLVQARGKTWAELIFQEFVKFK
jgi:predicted dinucleotide-binding enzyme